MCYFGNKDGERYIPAHNEKIMILTLRMQNAVGRAVLVLCVSGVLFVLAVDRH